VSIFEEREHSFLLDEFSCFFFFWESIFNIDSIMFFNGFEEFVGFWVESSGIKRENSEWETGL